MCVQLNYAKLTSNKKKRAISPYKLSESFGFGSQELDVAELIILSLPKNKPLETISFGF
jgi:hypothetical protein